MQTSHIHHFIIQDRTESAAEIAQPMSLRKFSILGLSWIELALLCGAIMLFAFMAIPKLINNNTAQERSTQIALRSMLTHARQLAIKDQREICAQIGPKQARLVYVVEGQCSPTAGVLAPPQYCADQFKPCLFEVLVPNKSIFTNLELRFNAKGQTLPNGTFFIAVGSLTLSIQANSGVAI